MELLKRAILLFSIFFLARNAAASNIGGTRQDILQNQYGGYENLLIAISKAVPEDLSLVEKLKVSLYTSCHGNQSQLQYHSYMFVVYYFLFV